MIIEDITPPQNNYIKIELIEDKYIDNYNEKIIDNNKELFEDDIEDNNEEVNIEDDNNDKLIEYIIKGFKPFNIFIILLFILILIKY